MATNILALSGKKQSGKNTCANFLLGTMMAGHGIVRGMCQINPTDGRLWISDMFGQEELGQGYFDYYRQNDSMLSFLEEHVHPFIKLYSFADMLKDLACIDILGLKREQVYGTDEQKNSTTHLRWENMPGVITEMMPEIDEKDLETIGGRIGPYYQKLRNGVVYHRPGLMTGREVMQFVGTEIFRKMYSKVWAEATIRKVLLENSDLAIITDCRFPDEAEATKNAGGKVIRLTREVYSEDTHESETALDKDKFDWNKFDAIIDNQHMDLAKQHEVLHGHLYNWGYVGAMHVTETSNTT